MSWLLQEPANGTKKQSRCVIHRAKGLCSDSLRFRLKLSLGLCISCPSEEFHMLSALGRFASIWSCFPLGASLGYKVVNKVVLLVGWTCGRKRAWVLLGNCVLVHYRPPSTTHRPQTRRAHQRPLEAHVYRVCDASFLWWCRAPGVTNHLVRQKVL